MELLPEIIRRKGFFYNLEKRGNKALIYKQTDAEDGYIAAYEVFKIKVDQPKVVFSGPISEGTEQKDVRSSIALADGRLYIRTASHLYCFGANP